MSYDIEQIKTEIESLPKGYISKKTIYGKERYYRQWTENGKVKSEYIPIDKYEEVKKSIERRKELEKIVKEQTGKKYSSAVAKTNYEMNVVIGDNLKELFKSVKGWKKRDCYDGIQTYLYGTVTPRVCLVYGLRRTGKTTMLHQTIADMKDEDFSKSAYIKVRKNQTMSMLDRDLKKLYAACCGVSDRVMWQMLKDYPNLQKVKLCLDSDEKGRLAVKRISNGLSIKGIENEILVPSRKDWNELLLYGEKEREEQGEQVCQVLQP